MNAPSTRLSVAELEPGRYAPKQHLAATGSSRHPDETCGSCPLRQGLARHMMASSRLLPCVPLRRSPARLLGLVWFWRGVRRPEARRTIRSGRSSRSNRWTRACHEGRRHTERSLRNANAHRFDPALEKEGRAVLRGRPLRGRHRKNADLFGRTCDRPSHVTLPHRGSPVPGLAAALWCSRYALRGL
jgi:hypothetical protein